MRQNICIQYQANVFCSWYPLNFMFAAAATCRFAESNLYHVFKTSRNCSARKHNKFGCVSVKSYIHSRCSIWTVFDTQKIRCIKLYIALLTISRKKNSKQKQRKNTFKMQLKSRLIFGQTTSNEWNFNRHFYPNWMGDLM